MNYTLSILVENKPGALTRVTGLIARRGFNIESLAVGVTQDPAYSRITVVIEGDEKALEQITKQLHKLVNVYKISNLTEEEAISRELVLMKVAAPADVRHEVIEIASVFRANVIDVGHETLTIEATGTSDKIEAMEELLRPYGIEAIARTGTVALSRGLKD